MLTESHLEQLHSRPLLDEPELPAASGGPAPHISANPSPRKNANSPLRGDFKLASLPPDAQPRWLQHRWLAGLLTTAAILLAGLFVGYLVITSEAPATIVAVDLGGEVECPHEVGDRVDSDWMQIPACVMHLSFRSSAMVAVHGPASFRVLGPRRMELESGTIAVHVPEAAKGFVVTSQHLEVEDLGTGFTIGIEADGGHTIHVTDGRIRVRDKAAENTLVCEAGDFVAADFDSSNQGKLQLLSDEQVAVQTRGQFEFAPNHVRSLAYDAFDHDRRAFVFLESKQRRLPYELPVNLVEPGRYLEFDGASGVLAAGTVVDCYLVHCAPKSALHEVTGSVTFPGEILGIICDHDRLNATNELLGAHWTLRCNYVHRGLEKIPLDSADALVLGSDRRTISATLRNKAIDQFRVLVKAD